jgi:tRNA A-37 threonylcarbamoyl transferase component Bud32
MITDEQINEAATKFAAQRFPSNTSHSSECETWFAYGAAFVRDSILANKRNTMPGAELPIVVDFDYTLTLESIGEMEAYPPNLPLIKRLQELKKTVNPVIKIVTARGNRDGLTLPEKEKKYLPKMIAWLRKYEVPYDIISFNKEEGRLFIDDITISETADFFGMRSEFTGNKFIFTEKTVTKMCSTALMEHRWYRIAERHGISIPTLRFTNPDCIVLERIIDHQKPTARDYIKLIKAFSGIKEIRYTDDYQTYVDNLPVGIIGSTMETMECVEGIAYMAHDATFFHGDMSTTNVLCTPDKTYLIDPNVKHVFGSYLTDAGKAVFSLIAYEASFDEAKKIVNEFGPDVWHFAVAEGLRVCKYQPKYISIVNNIADLI